MLVTSFLLFLPFSTGGPPAHHGRTWRNLIHYHSIYIIFCMLLIIQYLVIHSHQSNSNSFVVWSILGEINYMSFIQHIRQRNYISTVDFLLINFFLLTNCFYQLYLDINHSKSMMMIFDFLYFYQLIVGGSISSLLWLFIYLLIN